MKNKYHYEVTQEYGPKTNLYHFRIECWYGTLSKNRVRNVIEDLGQVGYLVLTDEKVAYKLRDFIEKLQTDHPVEICINNLDT